MQCDLGYILSLVKFSIFRSGAQIIDPGSKTQDKSVDNREFSRIVFVSLREQNAVPNQWMVLTNATSVSGAYCASLKPAVCLESTFSSFFFDIMDGFIPDFTILYMRM